jgi:hypothetical protein
MNLVRHRGDNIETAAKKRKPTVKQDKRCLVGLAHLADTRKQAIENAGRRGRTQQEVAETIGRFGCYLMVANDFANWEATRKQYELFASCAVPAFQPSQERLLAAERYAISRHAELRGRQWHRDPSPDRRECFGRRPVRHQSLGAR